MNEWNKVPFADLLIDSRDGEWGESQSAIGHQLCEIVRGTDFAQLHDPTVELPQRWIKGHLIERKRLKVGDIIFEMAGGTARQSTGRSALLSSAFFAMHKEVPVLCASFCRHLRLDGDKYCPQFIYYLLQALYAAGYMAVYNIQHTGVSRFQYTSFKKMTVLDIPLLPIQKKIAAVLSAYDDLIENNKRRIGLLEKMAEEIYREWFVRLRFPGHEKVKVVKGVPEGWKTEKVKKVVSRLSFGKIYRESELADTGKVIVIDQSQAEFLGFYDGEPQHKATAEKPIILFGDHSCKMLMMTKPFSLAENVIPFVSKDDMPPYFLFYLIQGLIETTEYKRHWTELTSKEVFLPPLPLQQQFQEIVKPYCQQMELLNDSTRFARKCSDVLLPRLISGKLSVENLDIQFPPTLKDEAIS